MNSVVLFNILNVRLTFKVYVKKVFLHTMSKDFMDIDSN